jgi:hypothetical protein
MAQLRWPSSAERSADLSAAQQTLNWVSDFVIKHALCPFAAQPFNEGRVGVSTCDVQDEEATFFWALTQVQGFVDEQGEVETLLLVFPDQLPEFSTFLDFVYTFEEALSETGADALVQLAHFHPDYQFEGVDADDPGNLTNRSPHPVLQFLRVGSVATAVAGYPDVEGIPDRNVERMREMFSV